MIKIINNFLGCFKNKSTKKDTELAVQLASSIGGELGLWEPASCGGGIIRVTGWFNGKKFSIDDWGFFLGVRVNSPYHFDFNMSESTIIRKAIRKFADRFTIWKLCGVDPYLLPDNKMTIAEALAWSFENNPHLWRIKEDIHGFGKLYSLNAIAQLDGSEFSYSTLGNRIEYPVTYSFSLKEQYKIKKAFKELRDRKLLEMLKPA